MPEALQRYQSERLQPNIDAVEFGRYLGSFIERGLAGPTSDPDLESDVMNSSSAKAHGCRGSSRRLVPEA